MKHKPIPINPETLVIDLRQRATLLKNVGAQNGYLIDADWMNAAANEIERLRGIVDELREEIDHRVRP